MTLSYSPSEAWDPLPEAAWNAEAAAHLLRRAGWTALPGATEVAAREGLNATLDRLFPAQPAHFPKPALIEQMERETLDYRRRMFEATPEERRLLQRELRERFQSSLMDMTVKWLQFSAQPENAAFQKWVLFLSDIYVVAFEKVPRTPLLYRHFDIIARHALGAAPALTKAISRSPAMILYLDLQANRREAPNENFARELFELFVLGEGNYTETDIKQSARAFTGYRLGAGGTEFFFAPRQHDSGRKTIFGHTGNFAGDDVIDLAYGTPAAGAFMPHEMTKFYLSDEMLPKEYLYSLGDRWRTEGRYDLRWIAKRFFGSKLFYAPEFRGAFIKSPVQYYLGMIQELELNVLPAPRFIINPMRQMGQMLFNPPNVRGWVGGRRWINSASLEARRGLVEFLYAPLNERALNQDELLLVVAAKTNGEAVFKVAPERFDPLLELTPEAVAERLCRAFLAVPASQGYRNRIAEFIAGNGADDSGREVFRRLTRSAVGIMQSAEYQLC